MACESLFVALQSLLWQTFRTRRSFSLFVSSQAELIKKIGMVSIHVSAHEIVVLNIYE